MSTDQTRIPRIAHAPRVARNPTWPAPFDETGGFDQTSISHPQRGARHTHTLPPPSRFSEMSINSTPILRIEPNASPFVQSKYDTIPALPSEVTLAPIAQSHVTGSQGETVSHQVISSNRVQRLPDGALPPALHHIPYSPDLPTSEASFQAVLLNDVQDTSIIPVSAAAGSSSPQEEIPHNHIHSPPDTGLVPSTNGKAPITINQSQIMSEPTLHGLLLNPTPPPVKWAAHSNPNQEALQPALTPGPVSHIKHDDPERKRAWWWTIWNILAERPWSWMICCTIAMAITLTIGITLGFVLRVKDFHVAHPTEDTDVQLGAVLANVDPTSNKITINWLAIASCPEGSCAYDIFFDQSLLSNSNAGGNNFVPDQPIFTITSNESDFSNSPVFTTDIALFNLDLLSLKERTLQAYPFDRYTAVLIIFARPHNDTNNFSTISILGSTGIAVGFNTELTVNFTRTEGISLAISITRGIEVRLYAVVIVISIWLITLVLLSAMISSVIFGRKMAREVMVIPVATLFAFTQLRGTLPGAPSGFGAIIDFVGVLPCLSVLTFCALFQTVVFLFRDPGEDRHRVEVEKMA